MVDENLIQATPEDETVEIRGRGNTDGGLSSGELLKIMREGWVGEPFYSSGGVPRLIKGVDLVPGEGGAYRVRLLVGPARKSAPASSPAR